MPEDPESLTKYQGGIRMKVLLVFLFLAAFAANAIADEQIKAKEVVITATRTEAEIEDIPANVTVITKEDIKAKGAERLKDIFMLDSGITITRARGRDFPAIRGMDKTHTLILIDGRRLAGEVDRDFELERITLEDVERIEIVKGPASALYGTDALGGVINIITKTPDKFTFEITPKYGAFSGGKGEYKNISAYLSSGKVGKFNFSVSGSYLNTNPYFTQRQTTLQPDSERKTINFRAGYEMDKYINLILDADYMEENTEDRSLSGATLMRDINNNYRYDLSLGIHGMSPEIEYFIRGYLSVYDKDYENRLATNALTAFDIAKRKTPVLEGKITKEIFKNHLFTVGGEYRHEFFRGTRLNTGKGAFTEVRGSVQRTGSEAKINYWAAYIQDEWVVSDRLIIIPAIRYDDSDKFASEVSPKLGITYKMLPELRLKASYGHGFKAPSPRELYTEFRHAPARYIIKGNPDVTPEKSDTYEIAIEGERGVFSARIGYFYTDVKNLIESVEIIPSPEPGWRVFTYQNIAKAAIHGVEANLGISLTKELSFKGSYAYLNAKDEEKKQRLLMRPEHKFVAKLGYDNKPLGFRGNIFGEYIGNNLWVRATATAPEKVKEYSLWHVNVAKDITKNFELYTGVDNVFNKKDEEIPLIGSFYYGGVRMRF